VAVKEAGKCIVAIRIRGTVGVSPDVELTLRSLRLIRKHQAVLLYSRPEILGMLFKVKDHVCWGAVTKETINLLLSRRGRVSGGKRFNEKFVKEMLGFTSLDRVGEALSKAELPLRKLWKAGLKPFFRLHPPKGGFKHSTKRPYKSNGELGDRAHAINNLVARMV